MFSTQFVLARILTWLGLVLLAINQPLLAQPTWRPLPNTTLHLQLSSLPEVEEVSADIVQVDMFSASAALITSMQQAGKKVLCYINFGAYENWRPDASQFPASVIGQRYVGWKGENWLDIRQIDLLAPIFKARIQQGKDKGCDGIEPDNLDGYTQNTGFSISKAQQLAFNYWLADAVHAVKLPIGQKNVPELVNEMSQVYDWATLESCYRYNWCGTYSIYAWMGKAVFQLEYDNPDFWTDDFCPGALNRGYSAQITNLELDGWSEACNLPLYQSSKAMDRMEILEPARFPAGRSTLMVAESYVVRHYPSTGYYLGVRSDHLYSAHIETGISDLGDVRLYLQ